MLYRNCGIILIGTLLSFLYGCAQQSDGDQVPASTLLLSSSLDAPPSTKSIVAQNDKLSSITSTCAGSPAVPCSTPSNVTGMLYYSGIMVGDRSGYSLGTFGPMDPSSVSQFALNEVSLFDFKEKLSVNGQMTCCEGSPYPSDDEAYVSRIEMYFAYVDVEYQISQGDTSNDLVFSGTHTVRNVYGDLPELGYKKGDLLYKGPDNSDDFFWCDPTSGCSHNSRPANPLQNTDVAGYSGTEDGLGSQVIPTFAANLAPEHAFIGMPKDAVLNNQWAFEIDFNMENALRFTSNPNSWTTIYDMLSAFALQAQPGEFDGGFTVTISASKTPI